MTPLLSTLLLALGAYLLGSVPFSLLLGFALGVDIRMTGSGNVGATNLSRATGRKWGITAFLLDFLKGLLPVLVAEYWVQADAFALAASGNLPLLAGIAAILGHVFPIYLSFRGGKGVATTFGAMAGLSPLSALLAGAVWLLLYLGTRTVSVASLASALFLPLGVLAFERGRPRGGFISLELFALFLTLLIFFRHRSNLARLLRGEELKFKGIGRGERNGIAEKELPPRFQEKS
jgi:glycerol-3-phosphate acyltransferase PlsY